MNVAKLPDSQAYVGSKETEAGMLGATEACKLLQAKGKDDGARAYILMGDLAHNAAVERTQSVRDALSTDAVQVHRGHRRAAGRLAAHDARWT